MKRPSSLWLWLTPLTLLGGCLLPSFENVASSVAPEGGSDSGGNANVVAGAPNEPTGGAGAPAGGNGPSGEAPKAVADTYVVQQGKTLKATAGNGVLANDSPRGLRVTAQDDTDKARPKELDAQVSIAADGSLSFKPAAAFFGRYYVDYTVEDGAGQSATATITFVVQPSAVELSIVEQGVGGVMLTGSGMDGIGAALAALGDVNADGFDDFAVGAPGAEKGDGAIYVVFGRANFGALTLGALAASSKEQRFAVLAGSADAPVGAFVSSAGRFDADKTPDIVVGSPEANVLGKAGAGALFVVFGGAGLKTTTTLADTLGARGVVVQGGAPDEQLGLHVSGGGDYDGNQKADLLAGLYPGGLTHGGVVALLENPVADTPLADAAHGTLEDSNITNLPQALAFAGDVNADGKDDWLASTTRSVALVFGQGSGAVPAKFPGDVMTAGFGIVQARAAGVVGVAQVASAGDVNADKKADFAYCDFKPNVSCEVFFGPIKPNASLSAGNWRVAGFTSALALPQLSPGADLNEDGFADLLLADDAAAYVVFGRDAGFGPVDVSSLGTDGFSMSAGGAGTLASVATIGDVNGDGYGDFAVGEPTAGGGVGHVYVVFGGPFSPDQR